MSLVLVALLQQNQRASTQIVGQNDATAQMMLVFEKVRNEVRHSRIIGSDATTGGLNYWICRTSNGIPQVANSAGQPDWLPGSPAVPDVALIYFRPGSGLVWRRFQGLETPLAPVGKDGSFQVSWKPETRTVNLVCTVGEKFVGDAARNNFTKFSYNIYVANNE